MSLLHGPNDPGGAIIGIDLGFGHVDVAGPGFRDGFPSATVRKSTHQDLAGLVAFDGHEFIVGEPAIDDPANSFSASREKWRTPQEMARFLAALARAHDALQAHHYKVVLGLPPADFKVQKFREALVEIFTGRHQYWYDGRPYDLDVSSVEVDPQGGAAYYDFLLDDHGRVDKDNNDLAKDDCRSAVLDFGFCTTDIYMAVGRRAAHGPASLKTLNLGVWNCYELLAQLIFDTHRTPITTAEVDKVWRRGSIRLSGRSISIADLKLQAVQQVADSLQSDIDRTLRDARQFDYILMAGGGYYVFGEHLDPMETQVLVQENPGASNAAGYFKRHMEIQRVARGGQ